MSHPAHAQFPARPSVRMKLLYLYDSASNANGHKQKTNATCDLMNAKSLEMLLDSQQSSRCKRQIVSCMHKDAALQNAIQASWTFMG